jgi:mRNA interferase HigB
VSMIVLGKEHVATFKQNHASQRGCIGSRIKTLEDKDFKPKSDNDMIAKYGKHFDRVGNQVVLDACGSKVRIIAKTDYENDLFKISHVLSHTEYDKNKWKEKKPVKKMTKKKVSKKAKSKK